MKWIGSASVAFWTFVIGFLVLTAGAMIIGAFNPFEIVWMTVLIIALLVGLIVYMLAVRHALQDRQHPDLARKVHSLRERRGF